MMKTIRDLENKSHDFCIDSSEVEVGSENVESSHVSGYNEALDDMKKMVIAWMKEIRLLEDMAKREHVSLWDDEPKRTLGDVVINWVKPLFDITEEELK